jgi:hypothetical protein
LHILFVQFRDQVYTTVHSTFTKRAMKKIINNGQMPNKHFFIVIYHSSLVKAAMNVVNCAMVLKKASISSFFTGPRRNKDHNALVNCGGIEFLKLR